MILGELPRVRNDRIKQSKRNPNISFLNPGKFFIRILHIKKKVIMAHKFVVSEAISRRFVYGALRIILGTEMNDDMNPIACGLLLA